MILLLILVWVFPLYAKEASEFFGGRVSVLSDRAVRHHLGEEGGRFEAFGNVIITQKDQTLYGDYAEFNLASGEGTVTGNVRFVGKEYTFYGTKITFNLAQELIELEHARVVAGSGDQAFTVVGEKIRRLAGGVIEAQNAQYTTCMDCPESWAVFGAQVKIIPDQYVRINHALLKVKDVTVFYVPIIIFPIKKGRQSGLLFPKLQTKSKEGFWAELPYFGNVNSATDAFLVPQYLGKRGVGMEANVRGYLGTLSWYDVKTFIANDRLYRPLDPVPSYTHTEDATFRQLTSAKLQLADEKGFSSHFRVFTAKDLDIARDFSEKWSDYSPHSPGFDYFAEKNYRGFLLGSEGMVRNPLLSPDPIGFNHQSVQNLPAFYFKSMPKMLWQGPNNVINNAYLEVSGRKDHFYQNHLPRSGPYIRNADRHLGEAALNVHWFNNHRLRIEQKLTHRQSEYDFSREVQQLANPQETRFTRQENMLQTEVVFQNSNIFGLSYREEAKQLSLGGDNGPVLKESRFISELPSIEKTPLKKNENVYHSYRLNQNVKLVHRKLLRQRFLGSDELKEQFQAPEGLFDYDDSSYIPSQAVAAIYPIENDYHSNALDFKFENFLTRKSPKEVSSISPMKSLFDHFNYEQVMSLKLSQGMNISRSNAMKWSDRLGRFLGEFRAHFNPYYVNLSERYDYQTHDHQFDGGVGSNDAGFSYELGFKYQTLGLYPQKFLTAKTSFGVTEFFRINFDTEYNISEKDISRRKAGVLYMPANNCWQLELFQQKNQVESVIALNLFINFSGGAFTPILKN